MKLKLLSVVAISALLAGGLGLLASCNSGNNNSGDAGQSQNVDGKYKVTFDESQDYTVAGLKEEYTEGEEVKFTVTVTNTAMQLSSVRYNNKKINAGEDGSYSFTMPAEDVKLKITVSEAIAPEFVVSYSGRTVIGEKLVFTATVDTLAFNDFALTAKSGADKVTISGHEVTLNKEGEVVFEATATKDSFELKKEIKINISAGEASLGTNITYDDHAPQAGIESSTKANRGTIITCGVDGGSINSLTYNKANDEYTMNYTNGWEFWSVQLFFDLPYSEVGDDYHFAWDVNSDVAGKMTISGHTVDLNAGSNYITFDVKQGSGALISIQFGVNGGDNLAGEILKFSSFRLYDANAEHKYHHVTFKNGTDTLKDIYVRDGKTVVAPEVSVGDNFLFQGFYEDTTPYQSGLAINKDFVFNARIVEKTAENTRHVTLKLGEKTIKVVDVFVGSRLVIPNDLDVGFGRTVVGYFKDAAFTQAYNLDDQVNADFDLYIKAQINFEATYAHDGGLGYQIPTEWISHDENGAVTITFNGWGSTGWHIQANFDKSVPIGEDGKQYTISFTYSMNVEGGSYQIYDGNSIGSGSLDVGAKNTGSITYQGGTLASGRKLTFELGACALDTQVIFTLHDIQLTVE